MEKKKNTNTIEDMVKAYQEALRSNDAVEQKQYFTLIYQSCEKLLWQIAWSVFRKCNDSRKYDCMEQDRKNHWSWGDFNYPLIHGLSIAAARYNPAYKNKFNSFAFSCVRQTLENHCRRQCPGRVRRNEEELGDSLAHTDAAPLDAIVHRQEIETILLAIKRAYAQESAEYFMITLLFLGFSQKDIAFLGNRAYPGSRLTEPLVSLYLNHRIPDALRFASRELSEAFSESELQQLTITGLKKDALLPAQFVVESHAAIDRAKRLLAGLVWEIRARSNCGEPGDTAATEWLRDVFSEIGKNAGTEGDISFTGEKESSECFDRYFSFLMRDGKKLKNFMKGLKAAINSRSKKERTR
jgi:hypothetical protein